MKTNANVNQIAIETQTLASYHQQADALRAELLELQNEFTTAQRVLNDKLPAQIVEANEKLVVAAMRAEDVAETAINSLEELARRSQHDGLTGTPNRALMRDRMVNAIAMAHRHRVSAAVIFVDIDHFKEINDTLGHTVGDEVLILVARRLEAAVRRSDTVSRHGGDEFLVLLAELTQESDASVIATKILSSLAAPCQVGKQVLNVAVSLGIALYPKDAQDADTLISRADAAMYLAKKAGGGSFLFFSPETLNDPNPAPAAPSVQPNPESHHPFRRPEQKPGFQELRVRERRQGIGSDRRRGTDSSASSSPA